MTDRIFAANTSSYSPLIEFSSVKKSDLFQAQTTHFQIDPSLAKRCHESQPDAIPVVLHASKTSKLVIGRGHDATIKIGKANKRVSREHVTIEHKPHLNGFEMTILSPNGALIDHIVFDQGEHVPIMEGTLIEIVGNKLLFKGPKKEEQEEPQQSLEANAIEEDIPMAEDIVPPIEEDVVMRDNELVQESSTVVTSATATVTTETAITTTTKTIAKSTINKLIKSTASKIKRKTRNIVATKPMNLEDEIIQVLVYTRNSTMTCTDITNKLEGQTYEDVFKALIASPIIGCVKRLGKTADGTPKEDLFYYKPENDTDLERRKKYTDVGRSARKCTMKDTQYFFRIPPKLSKSSNKIRKRINHAKTQQKEDEDLESNNSSDDVSDMEVYELFKDV